MKIALTGHTNIEKANNLKLLNNGEQYDPVAYKLTYDAMVQGLKDISADQGFDFNNLELITGMARGADEVFAMIALDFNLKLICSIPHSVQWHRNRDYSRGVRAQAIQYDKILSYCKKNNYPICEIKKNYNDKVFQFANFARNQHMVDSADFLISYKRYDSTGTDHCIDLGKSVGKYLGNV